MLKVTAISICAALILLIWHGPVGAASRPRQPLIYGIAPRPFPAVLKLDYVLTRASAWLLALQHAAASLPLSANTRISHLGFEPDLARLACAGLIYPLDVTTPEKAADRQVRIFLKHPPDMDKQVDAIFQHTELLLLEMCIIRETEDAVEAMRKLWPESTASTSHLEQLEKLASELQDLWTARDLVELTLAGGSPLWSAAYKKLPSNIAPRLAMAMESQEPSLLESLVRQILHREATEKSHIWNILASHALYLRGNAYQKLAQSGLAEADYTAALARARKTDTEGSFAAAIYRARGKLQEQRNNFNAMCQDFSAACSLGLCHDLSAARRHNLCLETAQ